MLYDFVLIDRKNPKVCRRKLHKKAQLAIFEKFELDQAAYPVVRASKKITCFCEQHHNKVSLVSDF